VRLTGHTAVFNDMIDSIENDRALYITLKRAGDALEIDTGIIQIFK
jgi:hypothetical protein